MGEGFRQLLRHLPRLREKVLAEGKDCILEIDVRAMQVKKVSRGHFIFLVPPSKEELARRITGRGTENEAEIQKRLKMAAQR